MKIFVKKLALKTTESTLRTQFEKFGEVSSVTIVMDLEAKRSKGFGFVVMPSQKDGNAAIKGLSKYKIDGKTIVVKEAGETVAPTPRKPDTDQDKKPHGREDSKKKGANSYGKKKGAKSKKTQERTVSKKWADRKTAAKKNKPYYKKK